MLLLFKKKFLRSYKSQQTLRCYLTAPRCGFVNTNSQLCPFTIFLVGWDCALQHFTEQFLAIPGSTQAVATSKPGCTIAESPEPAQARITHRRKAFTTLRRVSRSLLDTLKSKRLQNSSLKYSEKLPLTKTKRLSEYSQLIYPQLQEVLPEYILTLPYKSLNLWSKPSYWSS